MQSYSVYINVNVVSSSPRSGRQKRLLMEFIRSLGENPFQHGDYQDRDDVGHVLEVKIVGYALTFWPDHAVREIKVINVQRRRNSIEIECAGG